MGSINPQSDLVFSTSNLPGQLFINNEYVDAKNPATLSVHNPKDGSLVSDKVPSAGAEDVEASVVAAEAAFPAWKAMSALERQLSRITLGAPFEAFEKFEVGLAAEAFRYNAGWIDKFAGEAYPQQDGFMRITRHEPLGVTAGIVPWNGPMGTVGLTTAPALATGNCFILKPSEKTPFAALALGHLIKQAEWARSGMWPLCAGGLH
ncbi:hypothetical protein N7493_000095 [Penicillium malachiteum]|uniref:aldehyde dehydrogenase (NAD(+)) n=1 Tax=Penicillium malachiteum TaxID=1324776 RepID=A0AAD6HWB3_9EURO|nr:hypothetical protein N7493_000095 [Penicillium malachiteum]